MAEAIAVGDRIHVIARRLFLEDLRRHFVGTVVAVSGHLVRADGYTFVFDSSSGTYVKRETPRTRVIGAGDAAVIVNVIPDGVDIDALGYESIDRRLVLTDGAGYTLDINEFGTVA